MPLEFVSNPEFDENPNAEDIKKARYHIGIRLDSLPEEQRQKYMSRMPKGQKEGVTYHEMIVVTATDCQVEALDRLVQTALDFAGSAALLFDIHSEKPVASCAMHEDFKTDFIEHQKQHNEDLQAAILDMVTPSDDSASRH